MSSLAHMDNIDNWNQKSTADFGEPGHERGFANGK
jgi:hypothetical protein